MRAGAVPRNGFDAYFPSLGDAGILDRYPDLRDVYFDGPVVYPPGPAAFGQPGESRKPGRLPLVDEKVRLAV